MKIFKVTLLLCMSVLFVGLAVPAFNACAEEKMAAETTLNLNEMPLLTGYTWQKMTQDEKVAFVWGMGHVATIERESAERNPELKREGFTAKLCEGIAGMPMNKIVSVVDQYYKENPTQSADPVIKVIWDKIVLTKMKTGSASVPVK